ncbi:MAG: hypothetical protein IT340_12540 [Chloroflexi bacterium]|nr:hypothetical protein [Chloroflexota bacterium]
MSTVHTLAELLAYRHAVVRAGERPPRGDPDVFLWAANGIFIRGADPAADVLLRIAATPPVPGLAHLAPGVAWTGWAGPLPEALLDESLAASWAACRAADGAWQPREWQGYGATRSL